RRHVQLLAVDLDGEGGRAWEGAVDRPRRHRPGHGQGQVARAQAGGKGRRGGIALADDEGRALAAVEVVARLEDGEDVAAVLADQVVGQPTEVRVGGTRPQRPAANDVKQGDRT